MFSRKCFNIKSNLSSHHQNCTPLSTCQLQVNYTEVPAELVNEMSADGENGHLLVQSRSCPCP